MLSGAFFIRKIYASHHEVQVYLERIPQNDMIIQCFLLNGHRSTYLAIRIQVRPLSHLSFFFLVEYFPTCPLSYT